jgi:hypothetical protein
VKARNRCDATDESAKEIDKTKSADTASVNRAPKSSQEQPGIHSSVYESSEVDARTSEEGCTS